MAHTYSTNLIHCVFSTKGRIDSISNDIRGNLHSYLFGIGRNLGIETLAIGGPTNHIHILMALPPTRSLSFAVRDLKANSSRWMSERGPQFSWQEGFGAFSVSPSQAPQVKAYIRNQVEHHRKRTFEEEFLLLLKKSGIEHDLKHVFG